MTSKTTRNFDEILRGCTWEIGAGVYSVSNGIITKITQNPPSAYSSEYAGWTVTRIGIAISEVAIQTDIHFCYISGPSQLDEKGIDL